jgi:hypothetical protein
MIRSCGPRLAQPGHDQLDHGGGVLGTVDPATAQDAGQHGLAREHIQGQVAVVVVVGVKELGVSAAGRARGMSEASMSSTSSSGQVAWLAMNWSISTRFKATIIRPRGPLLQPTQGRAAAQFIPRAHRPSAINGVIAQGGVVIQVLVAAAQGIQALGDQIAQLVRDALLIPWGRAGLPLPPVTIQSAGRLAAASIRPPSELSAPPSKFRLDRATTQAPQNSISPRVQFGIGGILR